MRRRAAGACIVAVLAATAIGTAFASQGGSGDTGRIGWGARSSRPVEASRESSPAAERITTAQTIRTVWHVGTFRTFETGAPGLSVGDSYVFGGPLYDRTDTERIGFLSGHCVHTNPRFHGLATCTVTATPHEEGPSPAFGSQITLQGWNDDTPYPFKQAVTGGTGIYQNVRGEMVATPGDPFRIVFTLLP